jgi:hypothetical protein
LGDIHGCQANAAGIHAAQAPKMDSSLERHERFCSDRLGGISTATEH